MFTSATLAVAGLFPQGNRSLKVPVQTVDIDRVAERVCAARSASEQSVPSKEDNG